MAMPIEGGAKVPAAPVPTTTPTAPKADAKADKPAAAPAAPQAPATAPAPKSDDWETPVAGAAPGDKEPVALDPSLTVSRNTGEEIPSRQGFSSNALSAEDFGTSTGATGGAGTENPAIGVDGAKDAKFEKVDGKPFIKGSGDTNDIEWNDIQQGGLGDCYYMASLGTIAQQNPDLIRNAIKDNGDGTYTVRLYEKQAAGPLGIGGLVGSYNYVPKDITVTGDFPMKNGSPVFAGMTDTDGAKKELWPAIMEKAFAQMKGSYGAINGGNAARAMEMLTGKESKEYAASGVTLDQLDKMFRGGNAIVADSLQNGDKKTPYANGTLVGKHSYILTGVDKANGTVSLRNPWGPGTPDIKMSIADFNKYFDKIDVNPTK